MTYSENSVFICSPKRSAIGKFGGSLSKVRPDDLAAKAIQAVLNDLSHDISNEIDEIIFGCANQAGEDNRNVARMAGLLAGVNCSVPATTINRLCGSGMDAVGVAYRAVKSGDMDLVLAGGVESMSRAPYVMGKASSGFSREQKIEDTTIGWRFVNPLMVNLYGVDSMPETAENVAEQFDISREEQDVFALQSQKKAAAAQSAGIFAEEIFQIEFHSKNSVSRFEHDEHLRLNASLESLASLPTPFRENGTVTAGNASGVNDGAAALLVASQHAVKKHQLEPIAKICGVATAGVEPRIMGIGPVPAIQKLLEKTGITIEQVDVIELNEAFAAQALACVKLLGLKSDDPRLNPNGGAIALGHPLAMSGVRLIQTAALQLRRINGRYAICAMCIGVGQGIALLLENVDFKA